MADIPKWSETYIERACREITETLAKKGQDYTAPGDEFENFLEQARAAGIELHQVFKSILAQKRTREKNVRAKGGLTNFEPFIDSIRDHAGYAVLWYACELWLIDLADQAKPDPVKIPGLRPLLVSEPSAHGRDWSKVLSMMHDDDIRDLHEDVVARMAERKLLVTDRVRDR
jgi:hypothetical protein